MRYRLAFVLVFALAAVLAAPAFGAVIYNNLTPNNKMAVASRPGSSGSFEIEAADDFFLSSPTVIDSASFVGLIVPGSTGTPAVSDVVAEVYRVFPADSNTSRTPHVPTRTNSPSDVAFATRDSASSELTVTTQVLSASFTALNSVQPGGIHASPNQKTGGNGPLTGQEVQFNLTFTSPFDLPATHFFFVPQVELSNGGQFYWLSATRPVVFPPGVTDLQAWTRDANLDPDWLRVGTDIVGGTPAPTFNTAFALSGSEVPEPATVFGALTGLGLIALTRHRGVRRTRS